MHLVVFTSDLGMALLHPLALRSYLAREDLPALLKDRLAPSKKTLNPNDLSSAVFKLVAFFLKT